MTTKRWFCFITMVAVAVLLLSACKSKKSRISSDGEQKDSGGVVYDDTVIYVKDHDTAYRDGFVLYPQPIYDKHVMQIRLFDTTTRTDIPYCFRPECEHKPPTYDENGQPIGEVCTSYNLSNNTCFLLGENIYSFSFPCLYRFDRRGENVKTICELDMPQPIIWQTVYSKTDMYLFFYYDCEYEQTIDSGGHTIWLPGKRREDHITGILHVSLVDGSYEDITPKSDCKYRDVLNFRVEDAGLFFYYCDTDEDEMVTLNMETDSERYAWRAKHQCHTVYYYDAKKKDTLAILSKKGTFDYSFGDGFIVEKEGTGGIERQITILNLDGTQITELDEDKQYTTFVNSDKDLIYAYYIPETMEYTYCLFNIATGQVEQQVTTPMSFELDAAVGNSYYGLDFATPLGRASAFFWISKEDFWKGKLDQLVYLTK